MQMENNEKVKIHIEMGTTNRYRIELEWNKYYTTPKYYTCNIKKFSVQVCLLQHCNTYYDIQIQYMQFNFVLLLQKYANIYKLFWKCTLYEINEWSNLHLFLLSIDMNFLYNKLR
jgi:hypothetical protein